MTGPKTLDRSADPGRAKRAPPTIDLEATEISGETQNAGAGAQGMPSSTGAAVFGGRSIRSDHCGAFRCRCRGAGARRDLVFGLARPAGSQSVACRAAGQSGQFRSARRSRRACCRRRIQNQGACCTAAPAPIRPPRRARTRWRNRSPRCAADIAGQRAQSEKLAAALNEVKSAPRETSAPPVDLSAINERLAQIEGATRAQTAAIAQQESSKPADDVPLRRIVAAALLDVLVRSGDPYSAALAAAKALAANPDALKPLEVLPVSGVPSNAALSRELLTLVPKLSPPAPDNVATGAGLVDRLQAGAAKLVRIERTDTIGTDRGAIVARVTAAGLRNDVGRGPARIEHAGAGRSRRRASLARQVRCTGCCARHLPSIRRRSHGGARQTGAIGFPCIASFCFWC